MFNRILVVVAHPDDEVLGAGALLAKFAQNAFVRIVFLAEGSSCRFDKSEELAISQAISLRTICSLKALTTLGIQDIHFLDHRCGSLNQIARIELNREIERQIEEFVPDTVITHSALDANLDHRITYEVCLVATRPGARNFVPTLLSSEILSSSEWAFSNAFLPNLFIPITENELQQKIEALACYETEVRDFPFPRSALGVRTLAQYRGLQSGSPLSESFNVVRHIGHFR